MQYFSLVQLADSCPFEPIARLASTQVPERWECRAGRYVGKSVLLLLSKRCESAFPSDLAREDAVHDARFSNLGVGAHGTKGLIVSI